MPRWTMTSVLDASFIRVRAPQPCRAWRSAPVRPNPATAVRPPRSRPRNLGANKTVAVEGFSVAEADHVQHAVAVERVIGLQRRVQRVLGVAQVDAVQVAGDLALHGGQVVGVPLGGLRPPRTGPVGVVVVFGQGRQELADDLNIHVRARHLVAPTTKLTVVAVLPPKFKRAEGLRILDLIIAGGAADLFCRVEQHPHTGSPDRVSAADQSSAGVDRQPAADLDLTVLDGLPRLARAGQPDVVDGQVLAGGEAVVHLEPVDVVEGQLRPAQGVEHRGAHCGSTYGHRSAARSSFWRRPSPTVRCPQPSMRPTGRASG